MTISQKIEKMHKNRVESIKKMKNMLLFTVVTRQKLVIKELIAIFL